MSGSSLDRLVDDILIQILQVSSVHAVLSLRQTSRRYYQLTKLRCVWYGRYRADVLARNLPPPGPPCPPALLSAAELEQRTLRALHLHRAWPHLSAKTLVSAHRDASARVDQVVFIPGGTELLTVQGDKVVHWLIVSWPGIAQRLKHIGEWTPFVGVPCRIVKDVGVSGVIAVGPTKPSGAHRFAKVLSTSLRAPFVTLCEYARVPGVVAGVWKHVLLLDTSREPARSGLMLLDWQAKTTGAAILPHPFDLFGRFLDFVVFADHFLVVWEHGVSVFPIPRIPTDGQVVVEHKRLFIFQEAISRPVGFTTCIARHVVPTHLNHNADLVQATGWDADRDSSSSTSDMLPTLTIAARSRTRVESMTTMMLVPLVDGEDGEGWAKETGNADARAFPYRLTYLPPYLPVDWPFSGSPADAAFSPRGCTALCLGSSGRGVFVLGRELRLVSPGLHVLPPFDMQIGPVFETEKALYLVDRRRQWDLDQTKLRQGTYTSVWCDEESTMEDEIDFDEGMGRFVVTREQGGFEVVQLD